MEGALSGLDLPPIALIGLVCRTAERSAGQIRGAEELLPLVAKQLGVEPRVIGSPPAEFHASDFSDDLAASRGCLLEAGGQVEDALGGARLPVLLAGDSAVALTTLPEIARDRPAAKVLYLDARGDFATPEMGEEYLGAMCLAGACGEWDPGLDRDPIDPARIVLCGVSDLGERERELLERSAVTVIGASLETLVYTQNALDGAPVFVHLDLDVLRTIEAEKLFDLLEAVSADCELVGLEVAGFDAPEDAIERQTAAAEVLHAVEPVLEAATRSAATA